MPKTNKIADKLNGELTRATERRKTPLQQLADEAYAAELARCTREIEDSERFENLCRARATHYDAGTIH